ncbi:hypothetical protein F2Q69_00012995 [Brassica cretica]|uniref:Uncharacterized protein n=1 Tax=Brassica cretica TaxID=69181 RepID=A0A8S9R5F5_BRACR|nr:hypothetical protein F2Q69_00012995 [Brassica cretica]
MVSIDARPCTSIDGPQSKSIDMNSRASIDDAYGVNRAAIDRQPPAPIDRRAPITYRVQMPMIDVARLNALRPKPKLSEYPPEPVRTPSEYPPEPVRTPSDDGEDPMEEYRIPTGRTLRIKKEKVAKHLKRRANDKEMESFRKIVFRIPIDKPFEDAYYTHRLWMFFKKTRDKEKDIRRMFCEAREKMRMRITLKKKSDPGVMADHLGLQMEPSQELFTFVDCCQKNSGGIVRDLEVQIVKMPQTISRRINDPGIIAACHCGTEYETEYSASIKTHTAISIDSGHQKSTDIPHDKSVDSRPDDWGNNYYNPAIAAYTRQHMDTEEYDEDYEVERAIEYRALLDEEDKLLHHSSWKRNAPSIDMTSWSSIDTQPHQRYRKRASTDTAYYKSIDTEVNHAQEGDSSIGSWADEHHHKSFAVETTTYAPGVDKLQDSFTYEELLNMQKHDGTDQIRAEAAWERTRFSHPIDRAILPSIDTHHQQSINNNNATSIDNCPIPNTTVSEKDKFDNEFLTPDEFGIFRDSDGYTRAIDGHITIRVHNRDIRRVLERASRDEPSYICLPRHANLFTQTKLVPEIYTKDEINEMFYGVCEEHEKKKEAFQMKLDGVYYPLNDSISWLTTFMEEKKQDIARI